jgi:hypothetical protein
MSKEQSLEMLQMMMLERHYMDKNTLQWIYSIAPT